MDYLTKPWIDANKYREGRLKEALYESELAEKFMENGLLRNAAGKAFQAVKAYLAAIALDNREILVNHFKGRKKIGLKEMERVDWIIATMPTSRMKEVASLIGDKELELMVEKALDLHEFQYNGYDKDAEVSRYANELIVRKDVEDIILFIKSRLVKD